MMNEKIGNFLREIETIKKKNKKQMNILGPKNTKSEIKILNHLKR